MRRLLLYVVVPVAVMVAMLLAASLSQDKSVQPDRQLAALSPSVVPALMDLDITAPAKSRRAREPLTFHGFVCTQDRSGHEAGYEWAEDKGIDDEDSCGGNSESFIEGCIAYVREQNGEEEEQEEE